MCDFLGWDRYNDERKEAHQDFKTALVQQFNATYGTDASSIETWLGLCIALDVQPLPGSSKKAKEVSDNLWFTKRYKGHVLR